MSFIYENRDERRFIDVYDHHFMANRSHFKFVAGMNVGEKRRSQLGSCDYSYDEGKVISLRLSKCRRLSLVMKVWLLALSGRHDLKFWFNSMDLILNEIKGRALSFSGQIGVAKQV